LITPNLEAPGSPSSRGWTDYAALTLGVAGRNCTWRWTGRRSQAPDWRPSYRWAAKGQAQAGRAAIPGGEELVEQPH